VNKPQRIGIDSYGLEPLGLNPLELLDWAHRHGAEGVQFSGLNPEVKRSVDNAYLKDLAGRA
jgi:hypothetical protein